MIGPVVQNLATLLAALWTIPIAQAAPPASASDPIARSADALPGGSGAALAKLIYPVSRDRAITGYTFAKATEPTYRADPQLGWLAKAHPGSITAMVAAMKRLFEEGRSEALVNAVE